MPVARKLRADRSGAETKSFCPCQKSQVSLLRYLTFSLVCGRIWQQGAPAGPPAVRVVGRWSPVATVQHSRALRAETSPSAPATKPAENSGFLPVFFLHVLHGFGVHLGSDHWVFSPGFIRSQPFSSPPAPKNAPDFGCFRMKSGASLFFCWFRAQNFRHLFCSLCRYGSQVEVVGDPTQPRGVFFNVVQLGDLTGAVAQQVSHLAWR